jgi:D-3-phosphoglycerate dehydrogenase
LAGTLFGEAKPWVVEIDGISIEAELGSHMLYIINADKPGFVGSLGTILAQAGVNIATLHLGRKVAGGKAVTLVEVDGPVSEDVMSALLRLPLVERAESLRFNRPARA